MRAMKKKLLFIIPSLSSGGGERSLVNLLNQINYSEYEVDLFLLNHQGLFMEHLPGEVKVLPLPEQYRLFSQPAHQSVFMLLAKGYYTVAFNRILYSIRHRYRDNLSIREQYNWKYLSECFPPFDDQYDAAIGFLEKTSTYMCVDKVSARKKIGWVHIDYDQMGMDASFDGLYFRKLHQIVTVSEECAAVLNKRFPEISKKVSVIHNIVSPAVIRRLADADRTDVFARGKREIVILSIGRLHYQKSFETAVEACKKLIDWGYDVQWNIIGEGEERAPLLELISKNNLDAHFHLLGLKSNPYPYLLQADIYVQTSRFEGKSIAIDEAKIMNKPIVVTDFSTAKDQIKNEVEGLIVEMNAEAVARGVERLINDERLRKQLSDNLSTLQLGTETEIDKLYRLLA